MSLLVMLSISPGMLPSYLLGTVFTVKTLSVPVKHSIGRKWFGITFGRGTHERRRAVDMC